MGTDLSSFETLNAADVSFRKMRNANFGILRNMTTNDYTMGTEIRLGMPVDGKMHIYKGKFDKLSSDLSVYGEYFSKIEKDKLFEISDANSKKVSYWGGKTYATVIRENFEDLGEASEDWKTNGGKTKAEVQAEEDAANADADAGTDDAGTDGGDAGTDGGDAGTDGGDAGTDGGDQGEGEGMCGIMTAIGIMTVMFNTISMIGIL